jgi:hypothetical protein
MALRVGRQDAPENVVWGFFDPALGGRVARLKAGRLHRDFGKQGVFRVAWKPRTVLSGVELSITDSAIWPVAATQLADLMDSLSGAGQRAVLRGVVVHFADRNLRFEAPQADSSAEGLLIFSEARMGASVPQRIVLHLRGSRAGQLDITPTGPPPEFPIIP